MSEGHVLVSVLLHNHTGLILPLLFGESVLSGGNVRFGVGK